MVGCWQIAKPAVIYQAAGCAECRNTGFRGRSGIYEMLTMTPASRKQITAETDLQQLTQLAQQSSMHPHIINGAEEIAAGIPTIEELRKVVPPLAAD